MPDSPIPKSHRRGEPITAVIADRVRQLREGRGMSQSELAEAVARLGVPWKRAAVVSLEKRGSGSRGTADRGRDAVTTGELLALALVLDVPPVALLADPRHVDTVPVASGTEVDAWSALLWLTGRQTLTGHPGSTWRDASDLLRDGYAAAELLVEIAETTRNTSTVLGPDLGEAMSRALLNSLAATLARISASSVPLPSIPPDVMKRARELGVDLLGAED